EPLAISYLQILGIMIPSTFIALMVGAVVANAKSATLERVEKHAHTEKAIPNESKARLSLFLFVTSILIIVLYATLTSKNMGLLTDPPISTNQTIMAVMLTCGLIIMLTCGPNVKQIPAMGTFKAGTTAAVCVLGVAWLGDTFIGHNLEEIKLVAGEALQNAPWTLSIVMFLGSILMYSQAATTIALMPAAISMGVDEVGLLAAFAATSALFVLPTYPTLLAAVEMDDTHSTKIGNYVVDHSFILPGLATVAVSVLLVFMIGGAVL
ncbi:MAG: anaerobic C4-dicarboxylate transporter family protein, partial [Bacteroidota bacterium]